MRTVAFDILLLRGLRPRIRAQKIVAAWLRLVSVSRCCVEAPWIGSTARAISRTYFTVPLSPPTAGSRTALSPAPFGGVSFSVTYNLTAE
jgi:hypothetical protein